MLRHSLWVVCCALFTAPSRADMPDPVQYAAGQVVARGSHRIAPQLDHEPRSLRLLSTVANDAAQAALECGQCEYTRQGSRP